MLVSFGLSLTTFSFYENRGDMMKLKTIIKLGFTTLAFMLFLTGCTQGKKQTVQYIHDDILTIQDEKGNDVTIPYKETMLLDVKGDYVDIGTDTVVYKLTDKYFSDNDDAKELLLTNLANGVKATYTDTNKEAIDIQTNLDEKDKTTLKVTIQVHFNELEDKGAVIKLFGLNEDDFDGNKVLLKIIDSYLESSGFVKHEK